MIFKHARGGVASQSASPGHKWRQRPFLRSVVRQSARPAQRDDTQLLSSSPKRKVDQEANRVQSPSRLIQDAVAGFSRLSLKQKAIVAIFVSVVALILPRLLLLGFVSLERLLISGIIIAEQSIFRALEVLLVTGASLLAIGFLMYSIYSFLFPRK